MTETAANDAPAAPLPVEAGWSAWPAPAGVLSSAEGIEAALAALGLEGGVARDGERIVFAATRRAVGAAALAGAVAGIAAYLVADRTGATPLVSVASVFLAALVAAFLVPSYRLRGRVEGGRMAVEVRGRGPFARAGALERRLRFYLERPAPGRPPER